MHYRKRLRGARMNLMGVIFWMIFLLLTLSGIFSDEETAREHIESYMSGEKDEEDSCGASTSAGPCKDESLDRCWGYEASCTEDRRYYPKPKCWGTSEEDLEKNADLFWHQGDFGFISEMRRNMTPICLSRTEGDSSLVCVSKYRYCEGKDILLDLRRPDFKTSRKWHDSDFLVTGEVVGNCQLDVDALRQIAPHKDVLNGGLHSWYDTIRNLEAKSDFNFDLECDVVIDKPTFLMRLDTGSNVYHAFGNFIHMFAGKHMANIFHDDINVLIWMTWNRKTLESFEIVWKTFSSHPLMFLHNFAGKRVCFKQAIFSFLPWIKDTLFHNIRLVKDCSHSGLYQAFVGHVFKKMNVTRAPIKRDIRITIIAREDKRRKRVILNPDELLKAAQSIPGTNVQILSFDHGKIPFAEQIQIIADSDILVGIHGAALTHTLFLPDWGATFELYNCGKAWSQLFLKISRLRGVGYFTWEDDSLLKAEMPDTEPKNNNFSFDAAEFVRILRKAVDYVIQRRPLA